MNNHLIFFRLCLIIMCVLAGCAVFTDPGGKKKYAKVPVHNINPLTDKTKLQLRMQQMKRNSKETQLLNETRYDDSILLNFPPKVCAFNKQTGVKNCTDKVRLADRKVTGLTMLEDDSALVYTLTFLAVYALQGPTDTYAPHIISKSFILDSMQQRFVMLPTIDDVMKYDSTALNTDNFRVRESAEQNIRRVLVNHTSKPGKHLYLNK